MEFNNVEHLKELLEGDDSVDWSQITQADIEDLNDEIADSRMRDIQYFLERFAKDPS